MRCVFFVLPCLMYIGWCISRHYCTYPQLSNVCRIRFENLRLCLVLFQSWLGRAQDTNSTLNLFLWWVHPNPVNPLISMRFFNCFSFQKMQGITRGQRFNTYASSFCMRQRDHVTHFTCWKKRYYVYRIYMLI